MLATRPESRASRIDVALAATVLLAVTALLAILVRETVGKAITWSAVAAGAAAVLLLLRHRSSTFDTSGTRQLADWVLVPLVPAVFLYLSFNAGGFFPGTQAFVAFTLACIVAVRLALVPQPLSGLAAANGLLLACLTLLGAWTWLSGSWSHAPGRALVEFVQTLVYILGVAVAVGIPRSSLRIRWTVRALALSGVVVCAVALATRLLPDVFPLAADLAPQRLSYPLTYWNALGILAALTSVLLLHSAFAEREPPVAAAGASAAIPLVAVTLYFTFSRGGIAAAVIGVVAFLVIGRPRRVVGGALAVLPATAIAVKTAYDANLLASPTPATHAAGVQGHHVAVVLVACMLAAAVLRIAFVPIDRRVEALVERHRANRRIAVPLVATAAVALIAVALAAGAPSALSRQFSRFVKPSSALRGADYRRRLSDPSNNGRLDQWRVGLRAFRSDPIEGAGAGTYQNIWSQHRPNTSTVVDAHSLYVEALAEMGLVGFGLVAASVLLILYAPLRLCRGRNRPLYAVIFAAALAWAVHAGIDWDWENPAVTLPVFIVAAACGARSKAEGVTVVPVWARAAGAVVVLAIAVVPLLLAVSDHRLKDARNAADAGNCRAAISEGLSATRAVPQRGDPYQLVAFCQQETGQPRASIASMRTAIERDPDYWEYRYDLALLIAATGADPRRSIDAAARLNPREPRVRYAHFVFTRRKAKAQATARTLLRRSQQG